MATSTQTEEYLSVYDLPHLLNMMSEISPGCTIFNFGLQLGVRHSKIEEFKIEHNNKQGDILREILYETLNRLPPLTKKEIVEALRAPSVQENRLANQIEANYIPQSQRGPQHVGPGSLPVTQTVHPKQLSLQSVHQLPPLAPLHQTSGNISQTLSSIQPPPQPNTSQLFTSQQLTTELPRTNQPQSNLDQVGQSHQLQASISMAPPPAPQTSQSVSLHRQPTLPELLCLEIPQAVGVHYLTFGILLLNDKTGSRVMALKKECQGVADDVILRILQEWLEGKGLPVTWETLIQTLRNTKLSVLADQIQASLKPQPTPQTSQTVFLQPQPSPSVTSLQRTPQMPTVPQLKPSAPPQTILPSLTQHWLENSQLAASRQPSPLPRQQLSPLPRQQSSPLPRQQPSPLPRQQPSPSPRQQSSYFPSQQPFSVSNSGNPMTYTNPPPAKRLRQQNLSPPSHYPPVSEATASTAGYPPLVNNFISFVKKTYSSQNIFKCDKWSLSPTVKFINLACIDRKCVKSREYNDVTKAMVMDGNVDAIEETKGPIKFSEIAKDISLPSSGSEQVNDRRLILVEGAPGVGKSTFAWEFCRKWMNGEIAQQYHLVLLLRLRDERIRKAKCLEELFFHPSAEVSAAVFQELLTSHTFHALIILEGYDELPDSCRNDPSSVFNELMSGKLLPLATVLVTSRPWATKNLHVKHACHIYQHIEVLGFTKKQIKQYINESIRDQKVRSDFDSYLEKHPQIRSGMYIPLNSAIVVAVYKDTIENDRQNLPNTITELYSCCIEILIRRHLNSNTGLQGGNEMNLPAINLCVPSDVHRNFVHMCHLAFSGILEATEVKLIFSESELLKHFHNLEHFDNLGFMDSINDLYVTGETVSSHNFLHLTFQEFFAAVHISTMSKEQQLPYFMDGKSDSGRKKGRLNVVLKFLAGLRKLDCFTDDSVRSIVHTHSSTPNDITVDVDVVNWLFESQSETAMSLILGERKVVFEASKSHMSPMDYYSLGYCISHSQCQWVLSLTGTMEISKEKIKMLADGAGDVTGGGKVVELGDEMLSHLKGGKLDLLFTEWNNILSFQKLIIEETLTVLPDLSQLEVLEVSYSYYATEQGIVTIANHLPFAPGLKNFTLKTRLDIGHITEALATGQLQKLERLNLEVNSILTDNSTEFLITFLRNSSSLQHLSIRSLTSSPQRLLELLQTVDNHPTLQEKSVKYLGCRVTTDVDISALSQLCSKYCDSMRTDFISYLGGLSDDGVVVLAEFLQQIYGSRKLVLGYGEINDDGTVSLAKALHHNSTIHTLGLWHNSIGDEGAVALADALHCNSTLQELNINSNSIGDEGAVALSDALHHNSTLQELNINSNSIGDVGTVALAGALHHNSTLQSLNLGSNSIGDDGAVALADALHHNSTLQSLDLSENSIGDEGAVALAEALLENQSLQKLYLIDNDGIGDRATGKFVEALTQNSSINIIVCLPGRCEEYATKCPNYHQVQTKLNFIFAVIEL